MIVTLLMQKQAQLRLCKLGPCTVLIFSQSVSLTQYVVLSVRLSACLFQLASGEVSLTILTSTIVGEYRRVFYNYPIQAQKMNSATLRLFGLTEQCHTQNFYLRCFNSDFDAVKSKFGLLME